VSLLADMHVRAVIAIALCIAAGPLAADDVVPTPPEVVEIEAALEARREESTSDVESEALTSPADTTPSELRRDPSSKPFSAPTPKVTKYDWIRLKSGEWLKGEINYMRDEDLQFDSDELDDLTLDWDDIRYLKSPRQNFYRFDDDTVVNGPAVIDEKLVRVSVDGERMEFPRKSLVAIVPNAERERDRWSGKVSVGATARAGNTDQFDLSASMWVRRDTPRTRLSADYLGDYSLVSEIETANSHRANVQYSLYRTRNFYVTPIGIEIYADPFSNISIRVTPGVGVGYHVFRGKFDLTVELGAAYQRSNFVSVPLGEPKSENSGAVLFSVIFESEPFKRVDFDLSYTLQLTFPTIGDTSQNALGVISFEITRALDLDVTLNWDRIQDPRQRQDGSIPKSDDFRLVLGLGLEF
jgi:hypothetical protein